MKTWVLAILISFGVLASGQQGSELCGFTQSPTEHIINRIEKPFVVRQIKGTVFREKASGSPEALPDVLIEIKGINKGSNVRRAKSDSGGRFKISHVPAGDYYLKATLNGYQSVVGRIVVSNKAEKNSEIQLSLSIGV